LRCIKLIDKWVGDNHPCYIIAEIGGAFKTFEEGKRLIDSALEINVDAVKFQTFDADTITTKKNMFELENTGKISQYEVFKENEISKELQIEIVNYAKEKGVTIFSAPSHIKDLEVMEKMDLPIYKIGSDLACHIPLLKKVAKFGKPIILSTGMCKMNEIKDSVNAILDSGNDQIILMHCVSDYPTKIDEANLMAITTMKNEFEFPVGYSDHTVGTLASLSAVTIGANVIERHFRDPRNSPGLDDSISLDKEEYSTMIESIRIIEKMIGTGIKMPTKSEQKNLLKNRVSIISVKEISVGTIITPDMIDIRRPGTGIQPIHYDKIIGKKAKKNINREEPISWDMLE